MGDGVFKDEIIHRCSDHAEFMIAHLARNGGKDPDNHIPWKETPLYGWFYETFPVSTLNPAKRPSMVADTRRLSWSG